MNFIIFILFIMILVFTCVVLHLYARLGDFNGRIVLLEIKTNYLERSEKTTRESVNLQTKCIRDLNDIVKKSVENEEPMEPDTKALLGGWIVEEPELQKEQPQQEERSKEETKELLLGKLNWQLKEWFSNYDSGGTK